MWLQEELKQLRQWVTGRVPHNTPGSRTYNNHELPMETREWLLMEHIFELRLRDLRGRCQCPHPMAPPPPPPLPLCTHTAHQPGNRCPAEVTPVNPQLSKQLLGLTLGAYKKFKREKRDMARGTAPHLLLKKQSKDAFQQDELAATCMRLKSQIVLVARHVLRCVPWAHQQPPPLA